MTVVATLVVTIVLLISGASVVVLQRRSMVDTIDTGARNRANDLIALWRGGALPTRLAAGKQEDAFAQVVRGGRVVAASENVEGEAPLAPTARSMAPATRRVGPLGGRFRVVVRTFAVPGGRVAVVAGQSLTPADDATRTLLISLAVGIPMLVAVVLAVTWAVTGRALRPVERIRREVAEISERHLHRRIVEPGTADEVHELARTMNEMLDRLEAAYAREARFVSDAAHELQTPIARLRARLEVELASNGDPDRLERDRVTLEDVTALQRLVEDLLTLARAPSEVREAGRELVDLDDLVIREADRLRTRGRVRVDLTKVSSGQVLGVRHDLERALRNLVDNAERHAATAVTFEVSEQNGDVALVVADDGPGIPPAERERVFDRFARLDPARTADSGGTGLGLAIAREIVTAHGGTLRATDADRGARFVAHFPCPPAADLA